MFISCEGFASLKQEMTYIYYILHVLPTKTLKEDKIEELGNYGR